MSDQIDPKCGRASPVSDSFVPTAPGVGYDLQLIGDTVIIFVHNGPEYEKEGMVYSGGVVAELHFDEAAFRRFRGTVEAAFRHFEGLAFMRRWGKGKQPK